MFKPTNNRIWLIKIAPVIPHWHKQHKCPSVWYNCCKDALSHIYLEDAAFWSHKKKQWWMVTRMHLSPIWELRRVCSNEHCLNCHVARSDTWSQYLKTLTVILYFEDINYCSWNKEFWSHPRNSNICAFPSDIYQSIIIVTKGAAVYP